MMRKSHKNTGFALIEVLIAITILSIILLSVYSGISSSINVITGAKNYSAAMIIAKTKLNEFRMNKMHAPDVSEEPVEGYESFFYSRKTANFEHPLLGPINAKRTEISVHWREKGKEKKYELSFIYTTR